MTYLVGTDLKSNYRNARVTLLITAENPRGERVTIASREDESVCDLQVHEDVEHQLSSDPSVYQCLVPRTSRTTVRFSESVEGTP